MSTAIGTAADMVAAIANAATSAWAGTRGWLSAPQVARRLGYSRQRIHQLIQAGKIPARRLGPKGDWRVPMEWVRAQLSPVIKRGL